MHAIVGTSALQIIRCIRIQGAQTSLEWFPEAEEPTATIHLPHTNAAVLVERHIDGTEYDAIFEKTLASVSFPFETAVSNKWIDCASIDGHELLDFRSHLELGVFDIKRRAYRKTLQTRLLRRDLPARSLIGAGKRTCFASPELVIIQLASQIGAIKLAQLIMEFAGYYSLPPASSSDASSGDRKAAPAAETVYNLPPVTTLNRIREFANRARMVRNRRTLDIALDIALEHSASPVESMLAIMFCTSVESGGYGMSVPLLNPQIRVPSNVRSFVSQDSYFPDVFFPDCKIDLEYESTGFHLDPIIANWTSREFALWRAGQTSKAASDRRRARELEALGVRIIPVIWGDISSVEKLDRIAWLFARHKEDLGEFDASSYMMKLDTYDYRLAREQLRETLLEQLSRP